MGMEFRPAIRRWGTRVRLPMPITRLKMRDSWDMDRLKIPGAVGDQRVGVSKNGVDVEIEGEVQFDGTTWQTTELGSLAAYEVLRNVVDVTLSLPAFDLVLYEDELSHAGRWLSGCVAERLEWDLSRVGVLRYSLVVHAQSPVLQSGTLSP